MPVRPAAALTFASSSSPDTARAAFVSSASAFSTRRRRFTLGGALGRRARAAEAQQLREPGRGLQRGIEEHVVVARAWIGLDGGEAGDHGERGRSGETPGRASR